MKCNVSGIATMKNVMRSQIYLMNYLILIEFIMNGKVTVGSRGLTMANRRLCNCGMGCSRHLSDTETGVLNSTR